MNSLKSLNQEIRILFKSVPGYVTALLVAAIIIMNLLANKSVNGLPEWLALDCGFILSWVCFLCSDTITKHYGPRAAIILSLFALVVNLFMSFILFLVSLVPGTWGAFYDCGELPQVNEALNITFGGTWYVIFGSSVAFAASAIVNALTNYSIGKHLKKDNFASFAWRSYISTAIGQFVDNLIFAFIVSHTFFGWSLIQCITCAITGMIIELMCEIIFSPIGYKISQSWKKNHVGSAYIDQYSKSLV